jgi:hypothetical protein
MGEKDIQVSDCNFPLLLIAAQAAFKESKQLDL